MAKYHIFEIQVKKADYRSLVSPQMMDKLQEQIMNIIVFQKKYRDKDYSAKKLAEEIGTNTHASFFRFRGIAPRQYREDNLQKHPSMVARRK